MEMAVPLIRLIYANAHSGPQHGIGFIYENDFCHYWVLASHAYLFGSKSLFGLFESIASWIERQTNWRCPVKHKINSA